MPLDHLVWGTADLDSGCRVVASLLGVEPTPGGSHPGRGTRNALFGLQDRCYLEVIAPDPAQGTAALQRPWLAALRRPGLVTWCVRADLARVASEAESLGLVPRPLAMSRQRPDGGAMAWHLVYLDAHPFGPLLPFFIDWGETAHPTDSLTPAGRFSGLRMQHPEAAALERLVRALGLEAAVEAAAEPGLEACVALPSGTVTVGAAEPFPESW